MLIFYINMIFTAGIIWLNAYPSFGPQFNLKSYYRGMLFVYVAIFLCFYKYLACDS